MSAMNMSLSLSNTPQLLPQHCQLPNQPAIAIIEEPMPRVRFRYATEGEKAGNIYGISSTGLHQTFPAVAVSFT